MKSVPFMKMHGLGNDFVVVDAREAPLDFVEADYRAVGDRRRGVGYDQFLTIEPAKNGGDAFMRIHNPDGSEAEACGNGTRCVAHLLLEELGVKRIDLETVAGTLVCARSENDWVSVNMGPAGLNWQQIPLAEESDTNHVPMDGADFTDLVAVNMGNPHGVVFVEDADQIDPAEHGPALETHPMFPEKANIEFVSLIAPDLLRMRVWERAAGVTMACGSGACASAVAAIRRDMTGRVVTVRLDGGDLEIEWLDSGDVIMTGPVAHSFFGVLGN